MAGIGFSLRKHLRKETYFGFFTAYLLAGVIGSGPWVVSICSMLLIGTLSPAFGAKGEGMSHFLATVTQLMAASLVPSGLLQLMFTRFIADRTFEEDEEAVVPNLFGALLVTTLGSALVATPVAAFGFAGGGYHAYRVLLVCAFVTLCNMWVVTVILSGMKGYWSIVLVFLLGYGITLGAALALAPYGAPGYLAGFCMGHGAMLFAMLVLITRAYPASKLIAFQFLDRKRVFPELALAGVFFNLGIWADKFVFWAYPLTSETLVGPIRYSVIYDVPIFVAYLTVIPGMAAFLVRIETDFAEKFAIFFDAVRKGTSFQRLTVMRSDLVDAAREGIYDVFRIQGLAVATLLVLTPRVLRLFRILRTTPTCSRSTSWRRGSRSSSCRCSRSCSTWTTESSFSTCASSSSSPTRGSRSSPSRSGRASTGSDSWSRAPSPACSPWALSPGSSSGSSTRPSCGRRPHVLDLRPL
ncbi:MAG: exopolysaccharide Pel transporter PelG [Myxococcales bacterium]|nr:exopolysaccharide Pel transporter PelG [Myxococcales bacterium]